MMFYTILVILIVIQIIDGNITKGKYYISFAEPRFAVYNFQDAEGICNSFGSNLASIHNEQQMMDVKSIIEKASDINHYIGYYTTDNNYLKWSWTDGSSVEYQNWGVQEPTDYSNAFCTAITSKTQGVWINILCNITHNDLLVDLYPFYPLCNFDNITVSFDDNNDNDNDNDNSMDIILINDIPFLSIDHEVVTTINGIMNISWIKLDSDNNKYVVLPIGDNSSIYHHELIKNEHQCKNSVDENKHNYKMKLHYTINMTMDHIKHNNKQFANEERTLIVIFNDCRIPIQKSQENYICKHFDETIKTKINLKDNGIICLTKYDIKSPVPHLQNIRPKIRRLLRRLTSNDSECVVTFNPTIYPTNDPTNGPTRDSRESDSGESDSGESDSGESDLRTMTAKNFVNHIDNKNMNGKKGNKHYNIRIQVNNTIWIGLYIAFLLGLFVALCWFVKN